MWLCATLQVGAAKYGTVYGSFAAIPIVLAWVYISWQIVLFGAEVAFAVQNCTTYRMEQGARRANMQSRIVLALSVIVEAARAMMGDGGHFEVAAYAREKRVPVRFLNEVVEELIQMGLLVEVAEAKGAFVLLRSPVKLRVLDVIDGIVSAGVKPDSLGLEHPDPKIEKVVVQVGEGMEASLGRTSVADLLA